MSGLLNRLHLSGTAPVVLGLVLLVLLFGLAARNVGTSAANHRGAALRPMVLARKIRHNACASAPNRGWLHTQGVWILDHDGCRVRLESVNWYGMETSNYVPAGLNIQPYTRILAEIKKLGFNSIRLPFSEYMVRYNSKLHPNPKAITKNRELAKLHPLDILDRIVAAAGKLGLRIILDNHGSYVSSPHDTHIEPIWTWYGEQGWINDWLTLVKRYRKNPTVVGFDIRNEPHDSSPVGRHFELRDYLNAGATWGPYPNARHPSRQWKPSTDWAAAATKCGDAILKINPHALIFVEGVELYPDPRAQGGVYVYWWGGNLQGVRVDPVVLKIRGKVAHQLVYSPHEWGPWTFDGPQFSQGTTVKYIYNNFKLNWAYILHSKKRSIRAPIWLGEFDTCVTSQSCVDGGRAGTQGWWFQLFLRYLRQNPEISWSYYPVNGTNSVDEWTDNGILDKSWLRVKMPALVRYLRTDMSEPKP